MKLFFWKKDLLNTGQFGEKIAAEFLKKKGYKILETNFKNPLGKRLGEIDIIARKDGKIIFIEVKTRALENYNSSLPEQSITPLKLHKLSKIANFYLRSKKLFELPNRFDAVSVWTSNDRETVKIKHIESIFI